MVTSDARHTVRIMRLSVSCADGEEGRIRDEYQASHGAE